MTGVLGVANGAVTIDDNGATASIKTVVVDGYDANAVLGGTNALNALTNLTLANSGVGTATVKTNEAIGSLAKGQFEKATAQAKAEVEKATKAASKSAK